MKSYASSQGSKYIDVFKLISSINIFAIKQLAAKFDLSSLNEECFRWACGNQNASVGEDVEGAEADNERAQKEVLYFPNYVQGFFAFAKAGTEQVRQSPRALTVADTLAAWGVLVQKLSSLLFRVKGFCPRI